MVEESPTYKRDKSTLNGIKLKAETERTLADQAAHEAETDEGGVIRF